jgi:serine/threonine protein kinase
VFQALSGCSYIPQHFSFETAESFSLLAMECLGPSISAVQSGITGEIFSLSTSLRIGIEIIRGLREVHSRGYLHRDIKPSNVVIRPSFHQPITLIDLGVARRFIDPETNQPIAARNHPGFVGTPRYASLNALKGRELGPRDDIISSVLTILEMRLGPLPWKVFGARDKDLWERLNVNMNKVFQQVPKQISQVYELARRLQRFEKPDYDLLISLLNQAMKESDCSWETPYEWMAFSKWKMKRMSAIPFVIPEGEAPNIPVNVPEVDIPEFEPMDDDCEEGDTVPIEPGCTDCEVW